MSSIPSTLVPEPPPAVLQTPRWGPWVLVLVFMAAFFPAAAGNLWRVAPANMFDRFQTDSSSLVEVKVLEVHEGSPVWDRGLLRKNKPFFENRGTIPLGLIDRTQSELYFSQFGLQGLAFALLQSAAGWPPERTIAVAQGVVAALTTLALAALVYCLAINFGVWPGVLAAGGFLFGPLMVSMARNLYWVPFTFFLPVVAVFILTPWCLRRNRWIPVYLAVFFTLFLKSLCGYEYLSNMVLGLLVPFLWFALRSRGMTWKGLMLRATGLVAASVAGFLAALAAHLGYLRWLVGSWEGAFALFYSRVAANTVASESEVFLQHPWWMQMPSLFLKYLLNEAVNLGAYINFGRGEFFLIKVSYLGLMLLVLGKSLLLVRRGSFSCIRERVWDLPWTRQTTALLCLLAGVVASASWFFLAIGHQHHLHLNNWMFWMYGVPFALALLGLKHRE